MQRITIYDDTLEKLAGIWIVMRNIPLPQYPFSETQSGQNKSPVIIDKGLVKGDILINPDKGKKRRNATSLILKYL